ncbi:MAG: flagellar hook-associated protein FlgK, partial [Burkholderiaceae bacterium]
MSDIAGIASNAVTAYQKALTTVSNNIANVGTDGYSRQDVALIALPVTPSGSVFLGSGVAVDRIMRQYNAFIESNLRNSTSDLASQEPMVNYSNRVVDIMGGQTMGLNTAFDQFFSSARVLSADTSSTVLRSSFVRDAQGVADRFAQLSAQLDLVQDETQNLLDSAVGQINTLTEQLALVNSQLTKQKSEQAQPPDLLDQRDLLLKQLSGFVHVNTRFSANGTVTVSLGPTISQDVVVEGNNALRIATNFNSASPEKAALMLDPYGNPSSLTGITSGTLAGLMTFREQVLGSTRSALNFLAQVFVKESNAIQQEGIDAYGQVGQALFKLDPAAANSASAVRVAFEDPLRVATAAQFRVIADANNAGGSSASISYSAPPA